MDILIVTLFSKKRKSKKIKNCSSRIRIKKYKTQMLLKNCVPTGFGPGAFDHKFSYSEMATNLNDFSYKVNFPKIWEG